MRGEILTNEAKNDIAKEEFSHLNKKRFNEIKKIENSQAKIFIFSRNEKIIQKITSTIDKLNHDLIGVSGNGEKGYKDLKTENPDLIFISLDLDGRWSAAELGRRLTKLNTPLIFIFNQEKDLDSEDFYMYNYGFIFENFNEKQIKFAMEVALHTHLEKIETIESYEDNLHEKNDELIVEKFYSVLIFLLSLGLIVYGVISRNVTFIQWIIFIPGVMNLILALISLKKMKEPVAYEGKPPYVSIFIPAHNEEYTIENTVRSIAAMDYEWEGEKNFEIIVVNDGSEDNTGKILANLKDDYENLRIITRQPPKSGKGKGFVLNDGLILSKGEVIGVFDADTRVKPEYLSVIMPYLNDEKVQAVQSRVRMYNYEENFLARMQDVEFSGFGNVLRAKDIIGYNGFLGGNGQFVKKKAILEAGKWDGFAVTEDLNLSVKVALNDGNIRYCPDVAIYQEAVTSWMPFLRQRVRWAMGNFETLFVYSSRIIVSRLSWTEKIGILTHVSYYAFNLFIFAGFLIFLVNVLAWFIWQVPTIVRMEAPLWIGITSAIAFLPGTAISLLRDDKKFLTFFMDLISYWLYCFYLIPLFFMTMYTLITRRERTWAKTVHKGDSEK